MKGLLETELKGLEEGREWTRRHLQEGLQQQIDEMGAVCPQEGIMLTNQRRRPLKLRSVSGVSTTVERGLKNDGCERGVDFGHKKSR